jgi:hypothetical protein
MTTSVLPYGIEGASCTIHRDAPSWDGMATAAVGDFKCDSAAAGARLLGEVGQLLRQETFDAVIGPMDGDTWHKYRLVSSSDGSPPFFMEPTSGPHDKSAFEAAGYAPLSSYVSARATLDEAIGPNDPVAVNGIVVTPWDGRDGERLIGTLFDMSAASFSKNAFFKPINRQQFLALYEPVMPAIDPRLVLFAFAGSKLVGFLFGLPNHLEGPRPGRVILKTYASGMRGVGHLLADSFHRTARDLGYAHVIHALMHVDNVSLDRAKKHAGQVFREYALMGTRLRP